VLKPGTTEQLTMLVQLDITDTRKVHNSSSSSSSSSAETVQQQQQQQLPQECGWGRAPA
jgi:hypothetical protein